MVLPSGPGRYPARRSFVWRALRRSTCPSTSDISSSTVQLSSQVPDPSLRAERPEPLVDDERRPENRFREDRPDVLPERVGLLPVVEQRAEDPEPVDRSATRGRAGAALPHRRPPPSSAPRTRPQFRCLGLLLDLVQTNCKRTTRTSAARSPDRTARRGTRRTGLHGVVGLITQRSLVQIQPAQRSKSEGVEG